MPRLVATEKPRFRFSGMTSTKPSGAEILSLSHSLVPSEDPLSTIRIFEKGTVCCNRLGRLVSRYPRPLQETTTATVARLGAMFLSKRQSFLLGCLVAFHFALGLGYALVIPPLNWPDEPAHLNYVTSLARGEGLGTMEPRAWRSSELEQLVASHFDGVGDPLEDKQLRGFQYQAHQPPAFYLLAALVVRAMPTLLGIRLLNLAFSCVALMGVYVFVRCTVNNSQAALIAAGFVALLPTRTFVAVSIGNDPMIELVFVLFFLVQARRGGQDRWPTKLAANRKTVFGLGTVMGVGLLTKATAGVLPLLQLLWFRRDRRSMVLVAATVGVAIVIASPWLLRNVALYGLLDPLALRAGAWGAAAESSVADLAIVERPKLALSLAGEYGLGTFFSTLFLSFWGVFGWMEMIPGRGLQVLYFGLFSAAVVGMVRVRWGAPHLDLDPRTTDALRWSLRVVGIGVLLVLCYSLFDFQPQGRYLLPFSAPLALLVAIGWTNTSKRWGPYLAAVCLVALAYANLYSLIYLIPWYLQ